MYYTSIAYKLNNKVYIGNINSGLKEIESFKPLFGVNITTFAEGILYIVMVSQIDNVISLYELDKVFFSSVCAIPIQDLSDDELIIVCSTVLSKHVKSIILH